MTEFTAAKCAERKVRKIKTQMVRELAEISCETECEKETRPRMIKNSAEQLPPKYRSGTKRQKSEIQVVSEINGMFKVLLARLGTSTKQMER